MADLTRLCFGDDCSDVGVTKQQILLALGYHEIDIVTKDTNDNDIVAHVIGTTERYIPTYHTTFFTDGTLIINEPSNRRTYNEGRHGAVLNEFVPLDEDNPYVFASYSERPYESVKNSVLHVEIGSSIAPTSMARWFGEMPNVYSIDLTNIDSSNLTDLSRMCSGCGLLGTINTEVLDTSQVTSMEMLFYNCFTGAHAIVDAQLDLSTWNTSNVTNMGQMFRNNEFLRKIIASNNFVTSQVTQSNNMFTGCVNLVGGNGTIYDANFTDKTYARIDQSGQPGYFT